ncbi:MAG TPA: DUF6614 family protein [Vicinamibacterales bacterium]|nr:DUF6614 family protein [Vicinamibacterales bacterium]
MIHYNVWFSFKPGTVESDALAKVHECLGDLKARQLLQDYTLFRHRTDLGPVTRAPFHAVIALTAEQFPLPFQHVIQTGVHSGRHGQMIENVDTFIVEVFEDLPLTR